MLSRLNKLLVILLVVAIASYIFVLNPGQVTVNFGAGSLVQAPLALILISCFGLGIIIASLFALYFGFKGYWRERGLHEKDRKREMAYQTMIRARSSLASGDWEKAREEWRNLVSKHPSDIIARIEYSRCLEGEDNIKEAIKVLDAARAQEPHNVEVLFRAAELNLVLGNKTAAIDNLALIIYHDPNIRAARLARDLAEELNRFDDALEYQKLLDKLNDDEADKEQIMSRIELKRIEATEGDDNESFKDSLVSFVRSHSDYAPALAKLSYCEVTSGNHEEGVRLLLRAAKVSGDSTYAHDAALIWLKAEQPTRAVSAVKSAAIESTPGIARVNAELELIKLYLTLNMTEEARVSLSNFEKLLDHQDVKPTQEILRAVLVLRGRCFNALGEYKESSKIWQQLSESRFEANDFVFTPQQSRAVGAPSPVLSTP